VAMRMVCKAMNIEPSGVESLLKSLQLDPAFPPNYDAKYAGTGRMEIKDGRASSTSTAAMPLMGSSLREKRR